MFSLSPVFTVFHDTSFISHGPRCPFPCVRCMLTILGTSLETVWHADTGDTGASKSPWERGTSATENNENKHPSNFTREKIRTLSEEDNRISKDIFVLGILKCVLKSILWFCVIYKCLVVLEKPWFLRSCVS